MEPLKSSNLVYEPQKLVENDKTPAPDSLYQGCNSETINSDQTSFKIPRTLYHLFFINFALKERTQEKEDYNYELIDLRKGVYLMDAEKHFTVSLFDKEYTERYDKTVDTFHKDIVSYFKEKKLNTASLRWKDIHTVVKDLWTTFPGHISLKKGAFCSVTYTFYRFLYRSDIRERAESLLLKCASLEWSEAAHLNIFYRSATLERDSLTREGGASQSLSFANSPLSGALFEGGSDGTCPLVYQIEYPRDFYALKLSPKKIQRYFFNPEILKGLYPLTAKGEFSHQRLRFYPSADKISGVQGRAEDAKKLAMFDQLSKPTIKSYEAYEEKIRNIYKKSLILIDRAKSK